MGRKFWNCLSVEELKGKGSLSWLTEAMEIIINGGRIR
jgi:hypothetical protein